MPRIHVGILSKSFTRNYPLRYVYGVKLRHIRAVSGAGLGHSPSPDISHRTFPLGEKCKDVVELEA